MRRSAYRRRAAAAPPGRNRRLFAVGAVITAVGAALAGTQIAGAAENDGAPEGSGAGKVVNGQVILTDTCVDSRLPAHDGFQKGDRCVSTEFGEVSSAANNSSLLITDAPEQVNVNTPFQLKVSTRNLIRDRFLAAGQGGYYVESSVLQGGIVRGHFHTACRILPNLNEAPDPSPVPAFFVATEDRQGGRAPDTVTINIPGLPQSGTFQCASWAGDGSHRIPMQERANETPALDAVRITVRADGGNNGGNQGGGNNGGNQGGGNQGGNQGGGNNGGQQGGGNNGGQQGGGNQGGGNNGGQQGGGNQGGGNQGGGNNGGQQGGGNQGGGNNGGGVTTPPTRTPNKGGTTTAPTTKDDFTPNPSKSTSTAKPESTTKAAKPQSTRTSEATESDATESDATERETEEVEPKATTKAAKPKASRSSEAAGTDFTYSNDDGQFNSGNKAPVADQVAQVKAESANKDEGLLASTGSNTIAMIGGAAVLLLIGLIIMAMTRRRAPGGTSWQ